MSSAAVTGLPQMSGGITLLVFRIDRPGLICLPRRVWVEGQLLEELAALYPKGWIVNGAISGTSKMISPG